MWTIGQINTPKFVEFYFIFYVVVDIKVENTDFYCTKMMVYVCMRTPKVW